MLRPSVFILLLLLTAGHVAAGQNPTGKKVLFIDSYHEGYAWSDGVTQGIVETLQDGGVQLKIHRMDTKRNRSEGFKQAAALKAKQVIEKYRPDVLIASDDNAAKYLIAPFYKNTALPVVFCGLNWDASVYGFPTGNITGMIEVELLEQVVTQLRPFARGERIGFLALDSATTNKIYKYHEQILGKPYEKVYLVESFTKWKEHFRQLQQQVDILILGNPQGIADWNEAEFISFAREHTEIPTGTTASWRMGFSLLGYIRIPQEQGRWAAATALKILKGANPAEIPIATNKEGQLMINEAIRAKLGIQLPAALSKRAEIITP
jgi:ABC-type uncharacterized transport system substrate-binding protein